MGVWEIAFVVAVGMFFYFLFSFIIIALFLLFGHLIFNHIFKDFDIK